MRCNKRIIAHRGDRSRGRENTLESFRLAIECGADMIELDVRRAADGELVVYHDDNLGGVAISASTYPEIARRSGEQGFRVPSFREVLEATAGRIALDVELKEDGYEARVVAAMFDHRFGVEDFVLTSFKADAVRTVRREFPGIRTGLLVEDMTPAEALRLFRELQPDYLAPDHRLLDSEMLAECSSSHVELLVWTVNDDGRIRELLLAAPVAGVVTDRPLSALMIRSGLERR